MTLTTPDYENAQYTYPLIKGNYFTDNDVANANPVCVIDELTAAYLFGNTDVIGMNLDVNVDNNIQTLSVIGVRETPEEMLVAEKQYIAMGMSESISIEIPYTLSTAFGNPVDGFMSLNLMTYNKDDTARAARTAVQILNPDIKTWAMNRLCNKKPSISPICSVRSWMPSQHSWRSSPESLLSSEESAL